MPLNDEVRIDTSIYGGEEYTPRANASDVAGGYTPPTGVGVAKAFDGSALLAEGAANLQQNNREKASTLASVGAAITQWGGVKVHDWLTEPDFPRTEGFNPSSMLQRVQFPLDEDQEKFMLESGSPEQFQHRLTNLEDQRMAYTAMGDNGMAAFLTSALDPTYLGIDIASLGASRLARAAGAGVRTQRAVAGTSAVAGAYGVGRIEQEVDAISDTEVILNALANGAAAAFSVRGGKMVKSDAAFPDVALQRTVQEMEAPRVAAVEAKAIDAEPVFVKPVEVVGSVAPTELRGTVSSRVGVEPAFKYTATSGRSLLEGIVKAGGELGVMAKRISEIMKDDVEVRLTAKSNLMSGSRAYYDPANHAVYISPASTMSTQLHELTHAVTNHKIQYGLKNPDTAHGRIVAEMEVLRADATEAFKALPKESKDRVAKYFLSNLDEFVAGVFSGKSAFTDLLSKTPVRAGGTSILSKFVDSLRKLFGVKPNEVNALTQAIGLSEELMKIPLNSTIKAVDDLDGSMSIRLAPPTGIATTKDAKTWVQDNLNAKSVGKAIEWSLHKTLGKFSDEAKRIADILVDDPLDMTSDSVVSQQRAIRADLAKHQYVYEDLMRKTLAEQGFGLFKQITQPRVAVAAQQKVERELGAEMLRRNRIVRDGGTRSDVGIQPHITAMADALDNLNKVALEEMKRAGVSGAEDIMEASGYFSRRWDVTRIESMEQAFLDAGMTTALARRKVRDMVGTGIQRANGWDAELANDVAGAIIDRARRKGYFEDSAFKVHQGADAAKEVRDLLTGTGLDDKRIQRVLDVLTGKADEKGKAPMLKQRVDMTMDESIRMPDGTERTIADLVDMNMTAITDRYLDSVSAQSAFARKGFTKNSDILELRESLLKSIPDVGKREDAAKLFDQTLNALRGLPTGEDMPDMMRKAQAVTQMVGLAYSGMWQLTEYANTMARYGMLATIGNVFKEMPGARALFSDPKEAGHLRNVLARNAAQDVRIRPFIQKMEDNFEVPVSDAVQLGLLQAKQLVPYANAMKFIQQHQSRTVGNLMVNTFERAAKGDTKALEALGKYGLESHIMDGIKDDILKYGMDTEKWTNATWDAVRGPLTKMMDDSVLRNRTGEIPAFAQFSALGKFLFTFRSFVLGSHNKVLAGGLHREGFGGVGLVLLYQFPLTAAVTSANNSISGRKPMTDKELAGATLGQMGALGLLGEAAGAALGTRQQFGTPGLIAVDRGYRLVNDTASGKWGNAASDLYNLTPLLSTFTPLKGLGEALKDKKED